MDLGLNIEGVAVKPTGEAFKLKATRVALWDRYGGSMDSGWIAGYSRGSRPVRGRYPPELDAGDLNGKSTTYIFVDGASRCRGGRGGRGGGRGGGGQAGAAANIPDEFRGMQGSITADKTIPQLKKFVEEGGRSSRWHRTPSPATWGCRSAITSPKAAEGKERPLGKEKFYVPGSVVSSRWTPQVPSRWG